MSQKLNMALDDVIKQEKSSGGNRGARGARGARGQRRDNRGARGNFRKNNNFRQNNAGRNNRVLQNNRPQNRQKNNNFGGITKGNRNRFAWRRRQNNTGSIANRRFFKPSEYQRNRNKFSRKNEGDDSKNVLKELFSDIGPLLKCRIDYDELGRSRGSAIIKFEKAEDAKQAIQAYNHAELDGQKIRVEYMFASRSETRGNIPPIRRRRIFKTKNLR